MTVAVRGPWNYVPAWNPTVQLVTEEAAKQLMDPTAYVVYIMHAAGRVNILFVHILPQNALRRDCNGKCIEIIEGHYLEVVVLLYLTAM